MNAWPRIIMGRRLRDGNPCPKDQLEDLKHVGKMTFWNIKSVNVRNWKKVVQNRGSWKKVVEQKKTSQENNINCFKCNLNLTKHILIILMI